MIGPLWTDYPHTCGPEAPQSLHADRFTLRVDGAWGVSGVSAVLVLRSSAARLFAEYANALV